MPYSECNLVDFLSWVPQDKGRRQAQLAEEMGVALGFDEAIMEVVIRGQPVSRPSYCGGALRSSVSDLTDFWKEWERRNPQ